MSASHARQSVYTRLFTLYHFMMPTEGTISIDIHEFILPRSAAVVAAAAGSTRLVSVP